MEHEDAGLIADFIVESNEHLADVENQLLAIEASGATIDVGLVNTVFRAVHSVKGVAGFLGLEKINQLAHSLENVLNQVRSEELVPSSEITDVMLRAADELRRLINNIETTSEADISVHTEALDRIARGEAVASSPDETLDRLETLVGDQPSSANTAEELPATDEPVSTPPEEVASEPQSTEPESPTAAEPVSKPASASEPADSSSASSTSTNSATPPVGAEASIRVCVGTLDHLMNSAGELVLNRNRLLQVVASSTDSRLASVAAGLDQVTSELQEVIMQTRMQPVGNVFTRFPRIVRDLSSKLEKQCDLVIDGKDVEIDKTIIEAIGDPLTHLIRNSVDHGIESPQERVAKGKTAQGRIHLAAYHQAGKVCIDITDDGKGLDPEKLKKKALDKEVITPEKAAQMSQAEAIRLIFHAGFSTAKEVSDVSGRGVGMDVVRTNIEKLGGQVDLRSEVGVGTTVHIVLPLTLAILPSLVVECRGSRFAVPQVNILELVRSSGEESERSIGRVNNAEVLRLRGELLPLVRLDEILKETSGDLLPSNAEKEEASDEAQEQTSSSSNILVVETGQQRYGLVVDRLLDSEEIVVKPLGKHLSSSQTLAGATILGDGRIAWILDVTGIAALAELGATQGALDENPSNNETSDQGDHQTLLLFSHSPTEVFAVPMSIVTRIERIRSESIDTIGGQMSVLYRGGTLPLLGLEQAITVEERQECACLNVIIFDVAGHEVGLIAPEIEDIRDVHAVVDTTTLREPGVIGSFVINDRTTRMLDVFRIAELSNPEWFEKRGLVEQVTPTETAETTILIAEDSNFFRRQVTGFMQDEGYLTVEAEDGQIAWEMLTSGEHSIHMVITDIEMPNLNGFELCERIKADPVYSKLPVISLTSLAGDADFEKGKACGIDEYLVKMDRVKLKNAVVKLLRSSGKNLSGASAPAQLTAGSNA